MTKSIKIGLVVLVLLVGVVTNIHAEKIMNISTEAEILEQSDALQHQNQEEVTEKSIENESVPADTDVLNEQQPLLAETKADTPAFDDSSQPLHNLILERYGAMIDTNNDHIISIAEAEAYTGTLNLSFSYGISQGTMNGIGHFKHITELEIQQAQLIGALPEEIGNLTNLTTLNLSLNQLTSLPQSLGNLQNLKILMLDQNQLSELPDTFGNLTHLTTLGFAVNQLKQLPESFGNLVSLETLSAGNNQLVELPESFGNLINLDTVHLSTNQLTKLPESMANLTKLTGLVLEKNQLTELPETIGNLTNLQALYVNDNKLIKLPESIGNLSNLILLMVSQNQLVSLPETLGQSSNLMMLLASNNQFTTLPNSLLNLKNLAYIQVDNNQITSISQEMYDFLKNVPTSMFNTQTAELTLETLGMIAEDYAFVGYPAYRQFPTYDDQVFKYTLMYPDGTAHIISPLFKGDTLTITDSDLTQAGHYTLVAEVEGSGSLQQTIYTTHFRIVTQIVGFEAVQANGNPFTETSTVLRLQLSEVPLTGDLTFADIRLIPHDTQTSMLPISLVASGNGIYELGIDGTWLEGAKVDVMLSHDETYFDPNQQTAVLHTLIQYEVLFDTKGGSEIESQKVTHGQRLKEPAIPLREGYDFIGWYQDIDLTQPWNFTENNVTQALTLHAKWQEYIDETTHYIVADDVDLLMSELANMSEEEFLMRTGASLERHDGLAVFVASDTLKVLEHNVEAKAGTYTVTIAAHQNENVQKDVHVTVVDDMSSAVDGASSSAVDLPNTGVNPVSNVLWLGILLIIGGLIGTAVAYVVKKHRDSK